MKKFLLPIINLVNVVLVCVVFGLGKNPAYSILKVSSTKPDQNWYSLVWTPIEGGSNVFGIVGFFLFVVAVALVVLAWIPLKTRKVFNLLAGALLIAAGVFFLRTPYVLQKDLLASGIKLSDSLIAMAVLVFVAGGLALAQTVIELIPNKKEAK